MLLLRICLFTLIAHESAEVGAAEIIAGHSHLVSGVVMMIGGMKSDEQPREMAPLESDGRVLVMQPGKLDASVGPVRESVSAASRIMALSPLIEEAARATKIDGALLMAVIEVESGGNARAVSPKGASGLMQLMPATGMRHGASNLFDARDNILAGARYLQGLIRQFGDLSLALAAYNAGEGAVQKYGGQIPSYAETMNYVPKVIARYRWYRDAIAGAAGASVQMVGGKAADRFVIVGGEAQGD